MADNITINDAANATKTVRTTDNAGIHTPHHIVDALPPTPAGTNNIGDVDVVTLPPLPAGTNNIGDVDVVSLPSLPTGSNTIGAVSIVGTVTVDGGGGGGDASAANQTVLNTLVGATSETAPATDIATSGLNGRLQRIAQRLTSIIALLPAALGGAGGLKVEQVAPLPAGTNNIGDVDVLTLPALPTGTNTIGKVNPAPQTPNIFNVTVATAFGQFASHACQMVMFKARSDNAASAAIGTDNTLTLTANSYQLAPGESTIWLIASNTNAFYYIGANTVDRIDVVWEV